jgi:1-acyl-sn-glycerol-3-phosphate acyltransferase
VTLLCIDLTGIARWYSTASAPRRVRGAESVPPGGALVVVCNHSGGLFPMDVPIFATSFYEKSGYDRPVDTLSHDVLFTGPIAEFFVRTGFIRANRENADEALRSGGVVVVFPGGDYDVYRPTLAEKLMRVKILPISVGFPFELSAVAPVNVPLPTKIVMQVLEPIDVAAEFGGEPDSDEVDAHVRRVMQKALDTLAKERRLPIIG